jgi:signal recognition particle subunit SRP54
VFETLTGRFNNVFKELRRHGRLSEAQVDSALREVRLALLEADVNFGVVSDFLGRVRERAVGQEVSRALNPGQQVIKIVNEELVATLGQPELVRLTGPKPRGLMLVGLQGSGKTTTAGKLAKKLSSQGERVLLVAADPYRPAAVEQLQALGQKLKVEVFAVPGLSPPELAAQAWDKAKKGGYSAVILDTAGRSQLDDALMDELKSISAAAELNEVLLVADAMTGQEAVNIAQGFRRSVPLTGLILTKMDGDARGGAAISMRAVTGVPIKFLGTGEDLDALDAYDPARLASRILGMGDVAGLIEKAEAAVEAEDAQAQAEKMLSGEFTLEDFAKQLRQMRQMGPVGQLMDMLPGGMGQMAQQVSPQDAERNLIKTEAIINSMTPAERRKPKLMNASRKRRVASGSGTDVQDVNRLLKQHLEMQRLFKRLNKTGLSGLARMFG